MPGFFRSIQAIVQLMSIRILPGKLLVILAILLFNLEGFSQTKIDEHNVNFLIFYIPLARKDKVKEIKKSQLDSSGKITGVEISSYDTKGYLKSMVNTDYTDFFGGSELINIQHNNYKSFLVTRRIPEDALLKSTNIPFSFWEPYASISKLPEI